MQAEARASLLNSLLKETDPVVAQRQRFASRASEQRRTFVDNRVPRKAPREEPLVKLTASDLRSNSYSNYVKRLSTTPFCYATPNRLRLYDQATTEFFHDPERRKHYDSFNVTKYARYLLTYATLHPDDADHQELGELGNSLMDLMHTFLARASKIDFNVELHQYSLPEQGFVFDMSVTKALDMIFEAFNADFVARRMIQSKTWSKNALYNRVMFDESGNRRDQQRAEMALKDIWEKKRDRGTVFHEYINNKLDTSGEFVRTGKIPLQPAPLNDKKKSAPPIASNSAAMALSPLSPPPPTLPSSPLASILQAAAATAQQRTTVTQSRPPVASTSSTNVDLTNVSAFDRWNLQRLSNKWLLVASEYPVYMQEAGLAGTIDAVFIPNAHIPNQVVLVDWKCCNIDFGTRYQPKTQYEHHYTKRFPKCNYWKYAFQLNVYRELLERTFAGKVTVIDMIIVSFPDNEKFPQSLHVPRVPEASLLLDDLIIEKNTRNQRARSNSGGDNGTLPPPSTTPTRGV